MVKVSKKHCKSYQRIQKKSQFGAVYALWALPWDDIQFFLSKMQELALYDMWFQQDGATWDTAVETIGLLRREFGEHLISHSGPVNWQTRSCDLTPLDYFLRLYVKVYVYTDKPALIDALESNIEVFIREIPAEMLERKFLNWTQWMYHLRRSQHLHEILFKH